MIVIGRTEETGIWNKEPLFRFVCRDLFRRYKYKHRCFIIYESIYKV